MSNIQEVSNSIEKIREGDNYNSVVKNGIVFRREEVSGKTRFSYTIYLDGNVTEQGFLENLQYAKNQIENIIAEKKVEEKLAIFKAEKVNE